MKICAIVTVEVDPKQWIEECGVWGLETNQDVREDVKLTISELVAHSNYPFLDVKVKYNT